MSELVAPQPDLDDLPAGLLDLLDDVGVRLRCEHGARGEADEDRSQRQEQRCSEQDPGQTHVSTPYDECIGGRCESQVISSRRLSLSTPPLVRAQAGEGRARSRFLRSPSRCRSRPARRFLPGALHGGRVHPAAERELQRSSARRDSRPAAGRGSDSRCNHSPARSLRAR